jgi:hypothetical protein
MAGCCEYDNELLGSIECGEKVYLVWKYKLPKKVFSPWSYLNRIFDNNVFCCILFPLGF